MTLKILPWAPDTAWIISDLYLKDRTRCPFDCRQLMRNALDALGEQAFDYIAGLELEFLRVRHRGRETLAQRIRTPARPAGSEGNQPRLSIPCRAPDGQGAHVADMIRDMAAGLELPLRTIEAEWGPGQFEMTFNPLSGLAAADSLLLFRSAVKHLMRRHGLLASFMAKPALPNVYSSGWHLHQSLRNTETGATHSPATAAY